MDIMDGMSLDIEKANIEKLRTVFPDCVTEGKVDADKLLALFGQYVEDDYEKYSFTWKGKAAPPLPGGKRELGHDRECLH